MEKGKFIPESESSKITPFSLAKCGVNLLFFSIRHPGSPAIFNRAMGTVRLNVESDLQKQEAQLKLESFNPSPLQIARFSINLLGASIMHPGQSLTFNRKTGRVWVTPKVKEQEEIQPKS